MRVKQTAQKFHLDYSKNDLLLNEPCEEFDFNGKEADVIVYFTDGVLNLQTISRACQLLIIVSEDTSINYLHDLFSIDFYRKWIYIDTNINEDYQCTKIMNKAVKKNLAKKLIHVSKLKIIMLIILILLKWILSQIVLIPYIAKESSLIVDLPLLWK